MNDEANRAAPSSDTVTSRIRLGVSHEKCREARNERAPVAAAPVDIAPIMHCMHTQG